MEVLLKSLFEAYRHTVYEVKFEGGKLYFAVSPPEYDAFYAAVFLQCGFPENFLEKEIPRYSAEIMRFFEGKYRPEIPKNTTLLICIDVTGGEHPQLREDIHRVEEDPFDFKKHVLIYKKDQVHTFMEAWRRSGMNLREFLQRQLYDREQFAQFKQAPDNFSLYHLVTQLFINIPFLRLDPPQSNFGDLSQRIEESLKKQGLYELFTRVKELPENIDFTQLTLSMFSKED
jgi:hypothetical protein